MIGIVQQRIKEHVADIQEHRVTELFSKLPAGKMLRSKLILTIAPTKAGVELASIVELIHAASLLHDDVIDDATKRRGVDSINAIYGNKSAIMLGDILYSKAFFELTKLADPIPAIVSNAVMLLSCGELLDVELAQSFNPNKEHYYDMIYKKTGSLIEAAAKAAAVLAGEDEEQFATYGRNLGIAFQIVDDILDITQDSKKLGKPAMNDFKEGKTTLPFIYLYEALDGEGKAKLRSLHGKDLTEEEIDWLRESMIKSGAIERTKEDVRTLANVAMQSVRDNQKLHRIMQSLIERTY